MSGYTIYADLNCPFCYALHEQLDQLGLLQEVDWCLIEHAPDTAVYNKTPENQAELASEVFIVRSRAPSVDIALPPKRSDSRFATLCVIEAADHDINKAIDLRRRLYRSLWVEGKDIADISVIYECLISSGLPEELTIEEAHEEQLSQWQGNWENGGFNLRIPVLTSSDGRVALGLPGSDDLHAFFKGAVINSPDQSRESCARFDRQAIAIYTDGQLEKVWPLISLLRDEYNILLPASMGELRKLLLEDPPALLLLNAHQSWQDMLDICSSCSKAESDYPLPVAFIGQKIDEQQEIAAYRAGAIDFLYLNRAADVLRARISILLQVKHSQDQLSRSARIDGLTQVNNRREFERTIETEWRRAQRSRRDLNLIMIDVDHFKLFNDLYGHLAGDGCLRSVAQTIKKALQRAQDMVCRYGGEEFVVVLPDTDLDGAILIAERIRIAIEELTISHEKSSAHNIITISLGVASANPAENGSPRELIEQADKALYAAKDRGRNQVCALQPPASQ